jgi:ribosomal protein S18 acetylase RimI-like enzyme
MEAAMADKCSGREFQGHASEGRTTPLVLRGRNFILLGRPSAYLLAVRSDPGEWSVAVLEVAEARRRRGAASALLARLIDQVPGCSISLLVESTNGSARRLYERAGFTPVVPAAPAPEGFVEMRREAGR